MPNPTGFVADGRRRAATAVRRELKAKNAGRLKNAPPIARLLLLAQIEKQVEREVRRLAPPDALY